MNILFLQWKVKLPPQKEVITSDELLTHLGNCLLSIKPQEKSEGLQLNFQQNVGDAMTVLPKLATGLDVNVRFTGVSDFSTHRNAASLTCWEYLYTMAGSWIHRVLRL